MFSKEIMKVRYNEYNQLNLPSIAAEMLKKWDENKAFEKSVELRNGKAAFVFYEGPPSANGMPGIHHVISRTLKDLVCRYKTMQGYQVKRKGGWDTHGLPVELGVEKLLGITKEDIGQKISVEDYNKKCREVVMQFKDQWDSITKKMGYWVDLENPYVTFENNYIETLWWCIKELYKKDLLYEDVSIQPYSPAAGTGLSSHELNQPGTYKDVKDTSVVAMFALRKSLAEIEGAQPQNVFAGELLELAKNEWTSFPRRAGESLGEGVFFIAWTTTPWTLPSNLGLTVGENLDYALVKTFNPYTHTPANVILAKLLIHKYFKPEGENIDFENYKEGDKVLPWKTIAEFKGSRIAGCTYEQLLPFEANSLTEIESGSKGARPFRVITGDFVTTEDGTGIVHTAPAFGADDFKVGKKNNLGILTLVDKEGKFITGVGEFSGRYVKDYRNEPGYVDVNVDICVRLKKENRAFKIEKYEHNYPHCWRTDKPIIYYPLDAWFIRTTAVKDRMIELNKTINWKPASTGTGRFGNWLENMVDWNLSRSRFWGTPLPIWKCAQTDHEIDEKIYGLDTGFFNEDRFTHPYDQLVVGCKNELINVKTKSGWQCQGFYVDFKKLTIDILTGKKDLKDKIDAYNEKNHYITFQVLKEDFVQKHGFNKKTLIEFRFTLKVIEDYISKIKPEIAGDVDLHKPDIDNIVFSRGGSLDDQNLYARVDDLIDVWFDSGAMPYAQWGLPDTRSNEFGPLSTENFWKYHAVSKSSPITGDIKGNVFPADFIAEGVDQTRGWFYTLHALGVLLFDSVAYKTVVSNGLVLDKNGNKMSKRVGNVVDPFETLDQFGPDATRWYLITNASPWDSLKFDTEGIKEVQRKFFGTIYNIYQFFALYANVDGFSFAESEIPAKERPEIDRWILSALNTLVMRVQESLDDYEPTQAGRAIENFVDEQLSNWYVRLCRRRFWKGEYEQDKISAYQTLYQCMETLSKLIAPVAPFFADWLFGNLNSITNRSAYISVHHTDFPAVEHTVIDSSLEKRMQLAQDISSLILSLRKKVNIKVRQPLQKALIPAASKEVAEDIKLVEDIIKTETNIKEIEILSGENDFIKKKAKANFKTLGKKLGSNMKWASQRILELKNADIEDIYQGKFLLNKDFEQKNETPVFITEEDIEVTTDEIPGFEVASKGLLTVALDIILNPALIMEGEAREFVNRIQNIRKEKDFEVTDKIIVKVSENESIKASFTKFNSYICAEILADKIEFVPEVLDGTSITVNTTPLKVDVTKQRDHYGS